MCDTPKQTIAPPSTTASATGPTTAAVQNCPCANAKITSQTTATSPSDRTRTTVGVGEEVQLTFSLGSANWTASAGKLSAATGVSTLFTAPERAASVTLTAVGGGCTSTLTLTVIEPSGVLMERAPGMNVWHSHGIASVGIKTEIYILPATVSFENIEISEDDCVGAVTGFFVGTPLDGVHHAGHGAGVWVPVGPETAGKGSKINGNDTAQSGNCNFKTPYTAGTFDWPIPWKFRVPSTVSGATNAEKGFATVHQQFTIDATGGMTVSKAGASGSAALNDPSATY